MANTVRGDLYSDLGTVTLKLYDESLAVAGEAAGYAATESGTCPGAYSWAVAGSLSGLYRYRAFDADGETVYASGLVYLTNDDEVVSLDVIPADLSVADEFAAIESHLDEIDGQLALVKARTDLIHPATGVVVNNAGVGEGGELQIRRSATFYSPIEVGEDLSTAEEVYFVVKRNSNKTDDEALILISLSGGLERLAGEATTEPTWGEIGINPTDESITITIEALATAELCAAENCVYGIRKIVGGNAVDVVEGVATITATVARKVE